VSHDAPTVEHAALYGDGAEVVFSKYMDIDSVARGVTLAGPDGAPIPATVSALNAEPAADDGWLLASRFRLAFEGVAPDAAALAVTPDAVSYAGAPAQPYHADLPRAWHLDGLGLDAEYSMTPRGEQQIELQATGEGHYDQLRLSVGVNAGADVKVDGVSLFDENGRAVVSITTGDAGRATLSFTEQTTGFTATALLTVAPPGDTVLYHAVVNAKKGVGVYDNAGQKTASAMIAKGETVDVLGEPDAGWVFVRYGKVQGYMEAKYLTPIK